MKKHVLLFAFVFALALPAASHAQEEPAGDIYTAEDSPSDPGEIIDGESIGEDSGKGGWKQKWQQQRGAVGQRVKEAISERYGDKAGDKAGQLKTTMEQEAQGYDTSSERLDKWRNMKGEAPRFVKEAMSEEDRAKRLEEWKQEHPDAEANPDANPEAMRQAWEEWKAQHQYDTDRAGDTAQIMRQKYEEFLATRTGNERADKEKMKDFKFQNREEAIGALRKYNEWKDTPQAENAKAYVEKWKQMQGNASP